MFREESLKILEKNEVTESFPQNLVPGVKYFWYKKRGRVWQRVCKLWVNGLQTRGHKIFVGLLGLLW